MVKHSMVIVLLAALLVSGWAWFYAIPQFKEHQQKEEMKHFFEDK